MRIPKSSSRLCPWLVGCVLVIHACLLIHSAFIHSPTYDEVPTLVGGLRILTQGKFDVYTVNPPVIKLVAGVPVSFLAPKYDWTRAVRIGERSEWQLGQRFAEINRDNLMLHIFIGRLACAVVSLLVGWLCYYWARELFGPWSGLFSASCWCFCPNALGHGPLITPDVSATLGGLVASICFWKWLKLRTWRASFYAGLGLGLAEITKTTFLVFYPLWIGLWLWSIGIANQRSRYQSGATKREIGHITWIFAISILIINASYCFEGSFTKLKDYSFVSRSLSGAKETDPHKQIAGNRFAGNWFGELPVPLPESYVLGIDYQRRDFESEMWSYLRGQWRTQGWWDYYVYAMLIKTPAGFVLLAFLLPIAICLRRELRIDPISECMIAVPAVALLVFVSLQTGFNHHLRYVLPVFPFLYIGMSRFVLDRGWRWIGVILLVFGGLESCMCFPHSLSFFNIFVGGPSNGRFHLAGSNTDWGQDYLLLSQWQKSHPDAQPFFSAQFNLIGADLFGVDAKPIPFDRRSSRYDKNQISSVELGPRVGWYAISVNELQSRTGDYLYLRSLTPVDRIGYSIFIYSLTEKDVAILRRNE